MSLSTTRSSKYPRYYAQAPPCRRASCPCGSSGDITGSHGATFHTDPDSFQGAMTFKISSCCLEVIPKLDALLAAESPHPSGNTDSCPPAVRETHLSDNTLQQRLISNRWILKRPCRKLSFFMFYCELSDYSSGNVVFFLLLLFKKIFSDVLDLGMN